MLEVLPRTSPFSGTAILSLFEFIVLSYRWLQQVAVVEVQFDLYLLVSYLYCKAQTSISLVTEGEVVVIHPLADGRNCGCRHREDVT